MNTKRMLVAALILGGITMSAKETLSFKKDGSADLSNSTLTFNKKYKQDVFKLKTNSFSSASARDWDEAEVTGSGLFLNFGLHFPSKKFLNPYYTSGDPVYKLGFDFELGHYFRFAKINEGQFGIGLRATWLSLSYASMQDGSDVYRAAQISAFRLGPQFGFAIDEHMGVDAFYQIGFNLTDQFGAIDDPINSKDVGFNMLYTGVSHEVGVAVHYNVFSLGMGYRFGKLNNISSVYDGKDIAEDTRKSSVNNLRVTLGFKF